MNLHSLFESMSESWSQKYKNSINCSHPKGFSQKAHCAGKKKHNESVEMEMTCPDCGMCETHGNLNEIKKGQPDANGYTRCWPGKHAVGTKKGKNGGQVRNCVPNESQGMAEGGAKDRQWSNKDMERLRVATRDFDDIMASDGPEATKQNLIKKRIQTKPMAGPKGVLPEQGVAEEGVGTHRPKETPGSWKPAGYERGTHWAQHTGTRKLKAFASSAERRAWLKTKPQDVEEGYNDLGPEYGGAYVNGRSDDARMTEKLTRQAKAAAAKAGKTFSTSAEYRLWHMKQKSKKQGVAEAQTDYQRRRQRERDVDAGKPVKRQPKNPQNDYFARRKKERNLAEDQPVQLSPNISARPNQDPDSPEDWDYYYKDIHVAPGQDFHTQIKDQHLRQMDPAYNTMRAAFDNPTKPGPATPSKDPTGDTIIPSRPQAPEKMKDIEGNPVRLRDYVPGDPRISESRLYYNVIGTADKDLRADFGMRKDSRGWYLKESSSPKYKLMAQRAFGSPKLQEYNFPAGQATKGSEGVISPVGSIPRNQINKR